MYVIYVDKDNIDHCGGFFYPQTNEIIINKYVAPIISGDKEPYIMNLLKEKKRLRHIVVHELLHYAFTEYKYADDEELPVSWTVGLCSEENTTNPVDKQFGKKWKIDEWLDEVLTERLAKHISGWTKTATMLNEENISDEDKHIFENVKRKLTENPNELKNIVSALFYHDMNIFLES